MVKQFSTENVKNFFCPIWFRVCCGCGVRFSVCIFHNKNRLLLNFFFLFLIFYHHIYLSFYFISLPTYLCLSTYKPIYINTPTYLWLPTNLCQPTYQPTSSYLYQHTYPPMSTYQHISTHVNLPSSTNLPLPIPKWYWIWTADLWCRRWPLYQLSHNHCPTAHFYDVLLSISLSLKNYIAWKQNYDCQCMVFVY